MDFQAKPSILLIGKQGNLTSGVNSVELRDGHFESCKLQYKPLCNITQRQIQ